MTKIGLRCPFASRGCGSGVLRKSRFFWYSLRAMACLHRRRSFLLPSTGNLPGLGSAAVHGLRPLAPAFVRLLVGAKPFEARLPQQAVLRPFAVGDFRHQARLNPMDMRAVWRVAFVEGRGHLLY